MGNKYFSLFNVEIARAITSNTRFYIHLLNYRINQYLTEKTGIDRSFVVYNDTDSAYFTLKSVIDKFYTGEDDVVLKTQFLDNWIQENLDPVIQACNNELADILNAYEGDAIQAEREAIADKGVFLAKKKYFLRVFDMEGVKYTKENPYMKKMGIEIIKSSTPPFVKKHLSDSINIILDNDEQDVVDWVNNVKSEFITCDLSDISKTTSVGNIMYNLKNSTKFDDGVWKKATVPMNSRAAIAHNEFIESHEKYRKKYNKIEAGDKVKILYMCTPNPFQQKVVAFIDSGVVEEFRSYVDFDSNWDKYFISPLNIMVEPLGWNVTKKSNQLDLDDW